MFNSVPLKIKIPNSDIIYYPSFFKTEQATAYFDKLLKEIPWQQDDITLFGKTYAQPRLTALFGNNEKNYTYSNISMKPHSFPNTLLEIKHKIEETTKASFTTCLANLYRNGTDSNGWHADNEKELGMNPIIASVSLGQERYFHLKHKSDSSIKKKILLDHGSLLLMKGETQHHWLHQIPKTKKVIKKRINLTFRIIR